MSTTKTKTLIEQAEDKAKRTPGPGHYDIESLDKGFRKTTLGLSRGWK